MGVLRGSCWGLNEVGGGSGFGRLKVVFCGSVVVSFRGYLLKVWGRRAAGSEV